MFKSVLQFCLIMTTCLLVNAANASVVKMEDQLRPPEYKLTKPSKSHAVKKTTTYVNENIFSGTTHVATVNNVESAI